MQGVRLARVVIDTNVLVSGLLWKGSPRRVLLRLADEQDVAFRSPDTWSELVQVLRRPHLARRAADLGESTDQMLDDLDEPMRWVTASAPALHSRDQHDNIFLNCAEAADADYLITGDADLLALGQIGQTRIVTPAEFLEAVGDAGT